MQEYQAATGDRITIEYALFGGVNDSVERARELVRFLKGIHVFVNLIPFNAVGERYEKPKAEDVLRFRSILQTAGFETEIRSEQGADIDAACGQLRRKTLDGGSVPLEAPAYSLTKKEMTSEKRQEKAGGPAPSRRRETAPRRDAMKKSPSKPSGGFVAERGRRRRAADDGLPSTKELPNAGAGRGAAERGERPSAERYRSGKMKEARPSYRGQGEGGETPRFERRDTPQEREPFQKKDAFPKKTSDGKRRDDKKGLQSPSGKGGTGKKRSARKAADTPQGAFSKFYGVSRKTKRSKKS
ncbi:Dual-specificity RNA methyltransferase RlmN [bioreactor metagenome]|uniref:Dual-specificity RNA methyltransferase RlmN n=3 Tax=root TaxID=1 RepID=A0A645CRC6_9ZZZZ